MNTINLEALKSAIEENNAAPLVFDLDQRAIFPGYHVTEVKYAMVNSMDCGRGKDQWDEIIIQLLDGSPDSAAGHMSERKFMGIVGSAVESLPANQQAQLYFEFTPGNGPIQKLSATSVTHKNQTIKVALRGASAVCKPFQRVKAESSAGCCGATC